MDFFVAAFFEGLILVPITLLPIINPLSTAPVFAATVGRDRELAIRLARQVAINGWIVGVGHPSRRDCTWHTNSGNAREVSGWAGLNGIISP
jgi:hypothetical protein